MSLSFVRQPAVALGIAALALALALFPAAPAQAASFTFSDANCASFSVTGSNGAYTLSCASLACSITSSAGLTIPPTTTTTNLTASCQPSATGYTWTADSGNTGNCPTVGNSTSNPLPLAASGAAATCVYNVAATGGTSGNGTASITLNYSNAPPPAPANCTIAQAPTGQLPAGGGSVTLTASCATGSGISWAWQGGFAQGLTGNPVSGNVSASQAFTATATNSSGSAQALLTVSVAGGGGGGGGITCAGYAHTKVLDLAWATGGVGGQFSGTSAQAGGFGGTDAFIARFTTPSGTSVDDLGHFNVGEFAGNPATIYAKLSATACDFSGTIGSQAQTQYFTVGSNSFGANQLQPNTTYYYNMHHDSSCTGTCDVIIILQKPQKL